MDLKASLLEEEGGGAIREKQREWLQEGVRRWVSTWELMGACGGGRAVYVALRSIAPTSSSKIDRSPIMGDHADADLGAPLPADRLAIK